MAKVKLPTIFSPVGVAAYAWLARPDDKFNKDKPDYKVTLVLEDNEETAAFVEQVADLGRDVAKEMGITKVVKTKKLKTPVESGTEFNDKAEENERDRKEEFEGKVLVTFKSKYRPTCLIPADLGADTIIMSGDLIKVKAKVNAYEGFGGGVSLRLTAVKLIEKRSGGGDDGDWGDDDDEEYVKANVEERRYSKDDDGGDDDHEDY